MSEIVFIPDDTIEIAKEMGAYKKVRLGFQLDNVKYHTVRYDVAERGHYAVKIEDEKEKTNGKNHNVHCQNCQQLLGEYIQNRFTCTTDEIETITDIVSDKEMLLTLTCPKCTCLLQIIT